MKLAYLTTSFGTPSHTFIRREIRELRKQGIEVKLFGVRPDPKVAPDAHDLDEETRFLYPIRVFNTIVQNIYYAIFRPRRYWSGLFGPLFIKKLNAKQRALLVYHFIVSCSHARELERKGIQHIHAHFLNSASSITMFCSKLTGIPYSVTVHSAGEKDLPHVIAIPEKLKFASRLLMISRFNIGYYSELFPCQDKSDVVRCGMNIEEFEVRPEPEKNQNKTLNILAVGRFVEKKGFKYLIEAAKLAKTHGLDYRIDILGSGPLDEELRQLSSDLELSEQVNFFGQASTDQVRNMMLESDVVVVPSVTSESGEMEGIPVVIMEAMATGVPVIASAHSGIPELVNEKTGWIVPEKDSRALADAMISYEYSSEKVKSARKLIEDSFNIETVVRQRIEIFSKLLNPKEAS